MRPKGRKTKILFQYLRSGNLLRRLAVDSTNVLTNLIYFPAFLVLLWTAASCEPDSINVRFLDEAEKAGDDSVAVVDSGKIITKIGLSVVGMAGGENKLGEIIDALDVFVYGGSGTRELENYFHLGVGDMDVIDGMGCLSVESGSLGSRTVVVVANCPRSFNLKALAKMDSMELLEYEFMDEDTSKPLMSGCLTFEPGTFSYDLPLRPLLCEVVVNSVSNGLDDFTLLEEPSVRLCDMTPSARILQLQEFRPNEVISHGALLKLPNDIGFYTQKPDIKLWCYPNDTPETTLGSPHTSMEFNCRILGEDYVFPISLPPIGRGTRTSVDIIINGPDDCNCKFNQN